MIFAISMDYTVFLLSSAKEHWDRTGDPHEAMVGGLAHSGRVIFAAAAVMVAVFFTFALSGPLPPKEMGVILGVAVLLDALLVRLVLIPALLRLFGRHAWALPALARPDPARRPLRPRLMFELWQTEWCPGVATRPAAAHRARHRLHHPAGAGRARTSARLLRERTGTDTIPVLVTPDGEAPSSARTRSSRHLDDHDRRPAGGARPPTEGGESAPPLPGGGMRMHRNQLHAERDNHVSRSPRRSSASATNSKRKASASSARSTSRRRCARSSASSGSPT